MNTHPDTHQDIDEGAPTDTHFAHRQSIGFIVDLYWDPTDLAHEFRVEVLSRRTGEGLVLYPRTGREALEAFHHPFAAAHHQPTCLLVAAALVG